jgi:hypothetical protein
LEKLHSNISKSIRSHPNKTSPFLVVSWFDLPELALAGGKVLIPPEKLPDRTRAPITWYPEFVTSRDYFGS